VCCVVVTSVFKVCFTSVVYVYILKVRAYSVIVVYECIDVPSEDGL
jgi:hypothetical protein